jgi:hypothetical protein
MALEQRVLQGGFFRLSNNIGLDKKKVYTIQGTGEKKP